MGAGTMGSLIAQQMVAQLGDPSVSGKIVIAETNSAARHGELLDYGALPKLRSERCEDDERGARNVIVCLPPGVVNGRTGSYPEELTDACTLWAGPKAGGKLVLVSSTAVYGNSYGNTITEEFRVDTRSARSTRMLGAEEQVLERGGTVLRLAGLYTETRGPHSFWLKKSQQEGEEGEIEGAADGKLNMLHYEDAASAACAIFDKGKHKTIYLASDGNPISRAAICEAALASGLFPEAKMPKFKMEIGPEQKICDDRWTRKTLDWSPKHKSFDRFMRKIGGATYTEEEEASDMYAALEKKEEKASSLWMPGDDDEEWAL